MAVLSWLDGEGPGRAAWTFGYEACSERCRGRAQRFGTVVLGNRDVGGGWYRRRRAESGAGAAGGVRAIVACAVRAGSLVAVVLGGVVVAIRSRIPVVFSRGRRRIAVHIAAWHTNDGRGRMERKDGDQKPQQQGTKHAVHSEIEYSTTVAKPWSALPNSDRKR